MHCVIGSGPAGVACTSALLDCGMKVLMLDAGLRLEPERERIVERLRMTAPEAWEPGLVASIKENMESGSKGIPLKMSFGSDFPYRAAEKLIAYEGAEVGLRPSLAEGGFSTVWGAAMMPYAQRDLTGWPITMAQLAPHYKAVLKWVKLAGGHDDLEEEFPLYTGQPGMLQTSRQAVHFLTNLNKHRAALRKAHVCFGRARVGVNADCVHCGLCMYGCPYGYIYNSADTLRELMRNGNFEYRPNVIVTSLRESAAAVTVEYYDRETGRKAQIEARRVHLAGGAIPTTRILLESEQVYDTELRIKDSQYFLVPLLFAKGTPGVRKESLHTLSQIFLEIQDEQVSPHTVHLQVYSYNDLITGAIRKSLGPLALGNVAVRLLEERLMIVQAYLHSDHSPQIAAVLQKQTQKQATEEPALFKMRPEWNPQTRPAIRRVLGKLFRHARHFGAVPLAPMLQIGQPGRGFHSGSTFPMRERPGQFESDTLGRPYGWQRVHAVDSTVFPTIPATTITFSVMANAHRIASESATLD